MSAFDCIESKCMFSNPYWDYYKDIYIMPTGNPADYHFVKSKGAVMTIPLDDNNNFILTRQYRYLNKRESFEFPGGGKKPNLTYLDSARAELIEETGYDAGEIIEIGEFNPFNGVTDEICKVFLAKSLRYIGSEQDESESIDNIILSRSSFIELIKSNAIWDGMTLAAFSIYNFMEI